MNLRSLFHRSTGLLVALSATTGTVVAQTNTFPGSGNVGIGTTTPGDKLQVVGKVTAISSASAAVGTTAVYLEPNTTPSLYFMRSSNSWSDTWWNWTMGTDNKLRLGFSTVPQLTLQNGALGIGVDQPVARLDVGGTIHASDSLIVGGGHWTSEGMDYVALSTFGGALLRGSSINVGRFSIGTWTQSAPSNGLFVGGDVLAEGKMGVGTLAPAHRLHVKDVDAVPVRVESGGPNCYISLQNSAGGSSISSSANSLYVGDDDTAIYFRNGSDWSIKMGIFDSGNVGIGTTSPTHKLSVNGTIKAKEVIVETTGWSDYVFADDYRLAPLSEVEAHIKAEKRLPGIPSGQQVADRGVSVGEMQAALLAKIEELTLHQIEQEKLLRVALGRIENLEHENAALRAQTQP